MDIGREFGLKLRQHAIHVAVAEKGYPQQLDLTMLSMGREMGSTFLVTPYENDSGICKVRVEMDRRTRKYRAYFSPHLPKAIDDLMQKAWGEFAHYFDSDHTLAELSSNFEGCADKSMADVIAAVAKAKKSRAFDRILVIAEVGEWRVDKLVRVQQDPLIIGWVDSTSQAFYVTDYDMTPLEEYFRNQFAYGVTKHSK